MDRDNIAINAIGCLMQSRSSCSSTYQQAHCKIMAMRPFDWFAWLPKRLLHKTGLHNPVHQWYRPVSSLIYRNARCSLLAKVNDERDATKKKIATTTDWTLDAVGEWVCALAESTRNGLASTGALSTNRLELTSFEDCVTVWSAQNGTENDNRAGRPVSNGHSIGHKRTRYFYYYWLPYRLRLIDSLIVSPTDCARYYTIPS